MEKRPTTLFSKAKIRFQDCDPFNHLNNAAYLNYFMNAREDQLIEFYDIDIYKMARKEGKSWVVGTSQIAYLRPAVLMEEVLIESNLLKFSNSTLTVELRMYNAKKTELKAVMWSQFVHYNLLEQKKAVHSQGFMELFKEVAIPPEEATFEDRILTFRKAMM